MNGVHDLGGMHGFGAITRERDEPVFHSEWERRMFGLAVALMGERHFNVDEFRRAIERMPPASYLAASYYQRWLYALERLLLEKGALASNEIETELTRAAANVPDPSGAVLAAIAEESAASAGADASLSPGEMATGGAARKPATPMPPRDSSAIEPRFKVGDRVIARNINPEGHTRLPRYARGHRGVVRHDWGVFTFPDTHAHGLGANPQHCYCVSFTARELWGDESPSDEAVHIDLWEDYLEPGAAAVISQSDAHGASIPRREVKRTQRRPRTATSTNRPLKSNKGKPQPAAKPTSKRATSNAAAKGKNATKKSGKQVRKRPKVATVSRNKR
ncbi:MAG: nitrile hydratase subunit beta [Candidatus Binataceae bacterium]